MQKPKVKVVKKNVVESICFTTIDGKNFRTGNLLNILTALENTSIGMSTITLRNEDLEKILLKYNVVTQSVKGSYARSDGYATFRKQILNKVEAPDSVYFT